MKAIRSALDKLIGQMDQLTQTVFILEERLTKAEGTIEKLVTSQNIQ